MPKEGDQIQQNINKGSTEFGPEHQAILRSGKHREKMVPEGGFEPPTRGFSIRCSTN
jgi:hypothetical protein